MQQKVKFLAKVLFFGNTQKKRLKNKFNIPSTKLLQTTKMSFLKMPKNDFDGSWHPPFFKTITFLEKTKNNSVKFWKIKNFEKFSTWWVHIIKNILIMIGTQNSIFSKNLPPFFTITLFYFFFWKKLSGGLWKKYFVQ